MCIVSLEKYNNKNQLFIEIVIKYILNKHVKGKDYKINVYVNQNVTSM